MIHRSEMHLLDKYLQVLEWKNIHCQESFRELIIQHSQLKNENNLKLLENKMISLINDGTIPWRPSEYQETLYFLGILRHFKLSQIEKVRAIINYKF